MIMEPTPTLTLTTPDLQTVRLERRVTHYEPLRRSKRARIPEPMLLGTHSKSQARAQLERDAMNERKKQETETETNRREEIRYDHGFVRSLVAALADWRKEAAVWRQRAAIAEEKAALREWEMTRMQADIDMEVRARNNRARRRLERQMP